MNEDMGYLAQIERDISSPWSSPLFGAKHEDKT